MFCGRCPAEVQPLGARCSAEAQCLGQGSAAWFVCLYLRTALDVTVSDHLFLRNPLQLWWLGTGLVETSVTKLTGALPVKENKKTLF